MALIVVLSAFNGIEALVEDLYSSFDAEIRITPASGKTFDRTQFPGEEIASIDEVKYRTDVIEETTILKHENQWVLARMKGVEADFLKMTDIEGLVDQGDPILYDGEREFAIMGRAVLARLGGYIHDPSVNHSAYERIKVFGLLGDKKLSRERDEAIKEEFISVSSTFAVNPKYNSGYYVVPIDFARRVLNYGNRISAVEIGLEQGSNEESVRDEMQEILGDEYEVQTRYEQNELIYQTNKTEKWITFAILCFIFILATFNLIASLTMLILDKKRDISVLASMGATRTMIRRVFFYEGLMINFLGALSGLGIGLLLCWLQKEFALVPLKGTIIDSYPVIVEVGDIALILTSVLVVGVLSSYLPVRYLVSKHFQANT